MEIDLCINYISDIINQYSTSLISLKLDSLIHFFREVKDEVNMEYFIKFCRSLESLVQLKCLKVDFELFQFENDCYQNLFKSLSSLKLLKQVSLTLCYANPGGSLMSYLAEFFKAQQEIQLIELNF